MLYITTPEKIPPPLSPHVPVTWLIHPLEEWVSMRLYRFFSSGQGCIRCFIGWTTYISGWVERLIFYIEVVQDTVSPDMIFCFQFFFYIKSLIYVGKACALTFFIL